MGRAIFCSRGKVHMNVEALSLETGEAIRNGLEFLADGIEMIEPFLQAEVAQVVGTEFIAQETGKLLVLLEEGVFPVRPENMMSVFDLINHRRQFPLQPFIQAHAENLADPVRRKTPQTYLTAPLEDFVDREVAFEDEVPAVFDLRDFRMLPAHFPVASPALANLHREKPHFRLRLRRNVRG